MKRENKVTLTLLIVYLILLTWIILFKLQFSLSDLGFIRSLNLVPFGESVIVNGKVSFDEIINNFIVFIPVGIYVGMLKPHWPLWKKLCPVFGISLLYEVLQFIFAIGASDITDLITNTTGGLTGIAFVFLASKLLKTRTTKILNTLASICTILVICFLMLLIFANYS